ncbi:hypothetical protein [Cyclobacterium amurskyense]|uniref:General stress protein n=1 Tax=Cyclobacterium amurskyense TaxID=320787 RepID=A0A0H4PG42_9BACT|nr:hypothetical protein [Cyclobacterium amurskyense]AKP53194.1 hypothetical protein CA2015_3824 [Cyclobacterium amurskyense]|tara:strand:+ start:102 stop:617 length:516 start_codon:yes stop_codon:yes gene_type:complete
MGKQKLINRLKKYYPMERFHAFVSFPLIFIYLIFKNSISDIVFLLYGLLICIVILIQGQHYWKLKYYRLIEKPFNQEKNLNLFKNAKKLNLLLIGLIPVVFIIQLFLNNWKIIPENLMLWAVLANLFGIFEHINYYNRQLMVDNSSDMAYIKRNRKLKVASLAKDLKENQF